MEVTKFRFWSNKQKKWVFPRMWCEGNGILRVYDEEDANIEINQFTGLKDKRGREIYEGDIVEIDRYDSFKKFSKGIVFYWEEKAKFGMKSLHKFEKEYKDFYKDLFPIFDDNSVFIDFDYWLPERVLGNIFENPELYDPKDLE